ncbi:tenascin-R-like [Diaphorina citri]|uniref:Tenascin-R-like n=1 Tax=Diaphorina citri TaxID=121845 RepID=A0A1S4EAM8_DIACI|nr:tenascin-R-like [Diaphorina citri]
MAKVDVTIPENWTNKKRINIQSKHNFVISISNIWEERYLDLYKIKMANLTNLYLLQVKMAKSCEKSKLNEIYKTLKGDNMLHISSCFNGGSYNMNYSSCRCPPGFAGKQCEIACGENRFGHKCSKMCSKSSNECKGMVLCASYYGCSCATGYQGEQCLEHCPEGYYGADCKEKCGQCADGCDQYTGACRGGCTTPYLIWPACKYSHSYLKLPPIVLNSSFNTVDLHIDFTPSNIEKSYDHTSFYRVQYREDKNETWNNGPYEEFNSIPMNTTIDGLKPGTIYLFRVLLIDETLETHDPDLSKSIQAKTKCTVVEREENLKVNSVTNTSISLTWNGDTNLGAEECPFINYILELEKTENGFDSQKIVNIKGNSYRVETLDPGQTYHIKLKKNTTYGKSIPISSVNVTTDDIIDLSKEISGVTLKQTESQVNIEWFRSFLYKIYYIKYKVIRRLSCKQDIIESPLQVVTSDRTYYTLPYLEPNAQYQIFVTADKNQNMKAYNLTFITSSRVPDISPTLLTQKFKVTNESAKLYWTDFSLSCQHINGIFKKYNIELHDTQDNRLHMYETKNNHLEMTGLRPQTQYTVKVRYVNHIGFNRLIYVEHNFTTKATPKFEAQELTAYKTSSDVIGLRWKMPETNYTITKISIQLHSDIWNKTIDMDMNTPSSQPSSFQCKPWPSYICLDVTELKQNTKYRITVNVFSKEFPEGNPSQAINAVTRETMPSAVSDIKMSISDTNKTLSWRIPDLLNGVLRKFVIEVEHLSSFDETLCCQNIVVIDYTVASEQEIYSHILEDIKNASSYQITIRPFTKRLGPEAHQIFEIPPPHIPINKMPRVEVDDVAMVWSQTQTSHAEESSTEYSALASDILIIVHELNEGTNVTSEVLGFRNDMNHILNSNNWWVTHVCAAHDDNCSVDIDAEEGEDREVPDYGQVLNKPLLGGNSYRIVVVQVNKYLSARSYTVVMSKQFQKKKRD